MTTRRFALYRPCFGPFLSRYRSAYPAPLGALALALAALALSLPPAPALAAAKAAAAAAAQIQSFEMEPLAQVAAGTELFFRVRGTPGGKATVRVAGIARTIVLNEVDDGSYEGSYTLKASDRATAGSSASATLRSGSRSATATIAQLVGGAAATAQQAPAAAPGGTAQPRQAGAPAIGRFAVTPVDKIEPGAELKFALEGTPGAKATFSIDQVASNLPMRETASGRYEGAYTIRRLDKVTAGAAVTATLEAGGQTARSTLGQPLVASVKPPLIKNLSPKDGETVAAGPVSIAGTFDDQGGLGVDPKTVKLVVAGRDVTANSTITKEFFTYRTELAPGSYAADVSGRDPAGNAVRSAWTFVVRQQGAAATGVVLEVTSPGNNATVPGGRVEVRGNATPGATIDVQVNGVASVAGLFGLNQPLYNDRVVADSAGHFSFAFTPKIAVPGMRYEIDLKAAQGTQTKETKLVLFQQR